MGPLPGAYPWAHICPKSHVHFQGFTGPRGPVCRRGSIPGQAYRPPPLAFQPTTDRLEVSSALLYIPQTGTRTQAGGPWPAGPCSHRVTGKLLAGFRGRHEQDRGSGRGEVAKTRRQRASKTSFHLCSPYEMPGPAGPGGGQLQAGRGPLGGGFL